MKTTCPHCGKNYDLPEKEVMSAAGRILAKRRLKHGGPTSDQAAAAGKKGMRKRWGDAGNPSEDAR